MRKNLDIPNDIHDWYQSNAKEMSMPTSALIIFALKTYIDQQKSLVNIDDVLKELREIKKQTSNWSKKNDFFSYLDTIETTVQVKNQCNYWYHQSNYDFACILKLKKYKKKYHSEVGRFSGILPLTKGVDFLLIKQIISY